MLGLFCPLHETFAMSVKPSRWTKKRMFWSAVFAVSMTLTISVWVFLERQRRAYAERTHCVGNLLFIRAAKSICQEDLRIPDGDPISEKELERVFKQDLGKPVAKNKCPSGGTYLFGVAGISPKCSYTNICYTYRLDWHNLRLERRAWMHSLER